MKALLSTIVWMVASAIAHADLPPRVAEFVRVALTGVRSQPSPLFDELGEASVVRTPLASRLPFPSQTYRFDYGAVTVDDAFGRVQSAGFIAPLEQKEVLQVRGMYSRLISDDQAKALTERLYTSAGFPGPIHVWRVSAVPKLVRQASGGLDYLQAAFVPMTGGVPYERILGGYVRLSPEDGTVFEFQSHAFNLPKPPSVLTPTFTAAGARLSAAQRVVWEWGAALEDSPAMPPHLCIYRPFTQNQTGYRSWLDADEIVAANSGQGRLVYAMQFIDPRYGERLGEPAVWFNCYVDAITGKVLNVVGGPEGSSSLGATPPPRVPLAWPEGARMWRFAVGGGEWSREVSSALLPEDTAGFAPGPKVALTDGKTFFRASVDPSSGNLGLAQPDGKWVVGRPSPALRTAIQRTLESPDRPSAVKRRRIAALP